jgi:hypothetical protein
MLYIVDFDPLNISSNYIISTDMSELLGRLLLCSDLHLIMSNSNNRQNTKKKKKKTEFG